MRSPILIALVHPLNLAMLAASLFAGLVAAWWLFPLGMLFWLVMVVMVARDPALKLNIDRRRRAPLARRFQSYFDRIERAQVVVFNSLSSAPAEVRRVMQPVQSEMETLVNHTYALCQRVTNLDNYRLVTESQSTLENDLQRIDEAIAQAQDLLVQQEYEESRRSLQMRLTDREAVSGQLDRVEAQLLSLANEMDGVVTQAMRLQALGPEGAARHVPALVRQLRERSIDLKGLNL